MIRVMLVDDEKPSRDYIKGLIDWESNGFCLVAEAQSVDEALEQLAAQPIDLVLSDVYMPGKTGVELSREIAHRYKQVMLIAISSYDNYDYVREILRNGAHDYVLKHRLDSHSLLHLLQTAAQKLSPSALPHAQLLRDKIAGWLLEGQRCPFEPREGHLTATVARLEQSTDPGGALQQALYTGVEQLLESSITQEEQAAAAVYLPPCYFVVCTQFLHTVSEHKLQNALNLNNLRSFNSVRLLYKTDVQFSVCPVACTPPQLPQAIHERMAEGWSWKRESYGGLTIAVKKQLLTALEQRNQSQVNQLLEQLFEGEGEKAPAAMLILIRELTQLLADAAQEYDTALPPLTQGQQLLLSAPSQQQLSQIRQLMQERFAGWFAAISGGKEYSENVCNANRFMETYYGSSISLHAIAKAVGVSASYLSRIYRQETGMTVTDYLTHIRIQVAKSHISRGATLKETAFVCGFSSYNYFFKVFKNSEGMTPKEYVQQMNSK